jgi:sulfur-oxidizing protein SoxZ
MVSPIGQPRIRLPAQIRAGEVIEIRTLITHIMETGQRRDQAGAVVPRDIIRRFEAKFEGELVFAMDLAPAISANPYIAFQFRAEKPGRFEFTWTNDAGESRSATQELRLS